MTKRKLTKEEKRRKKERKAAFQIVFINGKQKRVPRTPMIEGLPVDEFIARNADPVWLHQNGMWEYIRSDDDVVDIEDSDANSIWPGRSPNCGPEEGTAGQSVEESR